VILANFNPAACDYTNLLSRNIRRKISPSFLVSFEIKQLKLPLKLTEQWPFEVCLFLAIRRKCLVFALLALPHAAMRTY
ncbi:MAG: hypothetical protein AAF063_38325, partial [Cyanobacteria bacterium J06643_5]